MYFSEYLEREGARVLLQAWLDLDNFQQHLNSQRGGYNGREAQSDAMVLYEKYVSGYIHAPKNLLKKLNNPNILLIKKHGGASKLTTFTRLLY